MAWRILALAACMSIVLSACGNAAPSVAANGNTEGVSAHEILVGGIASESGPLGDDFGQIFDGVRAYFDMINANGGINGRKIVFTAGLNDGTDPAQDVAQARALIQQYHVFAVVGVATPVFTSAQYLASSGVPTFGYDINTQWSDGPSLFGQDGSYLNFSEPGPEAAYVAHQVGATNIGVIGYDAVQSEDCVSGFAHTFRQFGMNVTFEDSSLPFGAPDFSGDVQRLKQAGVNFLVSCLDSAGSVELSKNLSQAGLSNVVQYWNDGYNEALLRSDPSAMEGVYLDTQTVPFEVSTLYPGKYPAMDQFLAVTHKYFPSEPPDDVELVGWIDANLFATGLKAIGHDVTRSRLVAAINHIKSYTAGGLESPVNWELAHSSSPPPDCAAFLKVENGRFVPVFGSPGSVFTCFRDPMPTPPTLAPIPLPPGVPKG
ncbi:MAG: ABC transporter substrate-binding protein [Actinobacteria bacterium]|nr:ABC transporter substrate-binding protein [Actinomycetota bacterium]